MKLKMKVGETSVFNGIKVQLVEDEQAFGKMRCQRCCFEEMEPSFCFLIGCGPLKRTKKRYRIYEPLRKRKRKADEPPETIKNKTL